MRISFAAALGSNIFSPHGDSFLRTPSLLWTFASAEILIGVAYFAIPVALRYLVRGKRSIQFNSIFTMFVIFMVACGATHFISVWNLWHGHYWLEAVIRAVAAAASVITAIMVWLLIPKVLELPSPEQLAQANLELEREIAVRRDAEAEIKKLNEELEERVRLRTVQLEQANRDLENNIAERARAEQDLQRANENLERTIERLAQRGRETAQLRQMGEMLQTCTSPEEANQVVARYTQELIPAHAGELYVYNQEQHTFEMETTWGSQPPYREVIAAEECWALRRGKIYVIKGLGSDIPCKHVREHTLFSVCVPLTAHGEVVGLLHLFSDNQPDADREYHMQVSTQLAESIADYAALALADINLRASLRSQAILDPLTGLYNRRFMEETLHREVRRIERSGGSIGLLMLDIDHFKSFNDNNGHEAGDELLKILAQTLKAQIRGGDVACRYGGEEFTIILRESNPGFSAQRAEQLRHSVSQITLTYQGRAFSGFTVSVGVASVPENSSSWEDALRSADQALYLAKQQGRNRVVVA